MRLYFASIIGGLTRKFHSSSLAKPPLHSHVVLNMKFELRLAAPDDVEALCQAFFSGFEENLIAKYAFPSTSSDVWKFWRKGMACDIQDPEMLLQVVEDVSTSPPTLVSFAKWRTVPAGADLPPPTNEWPKGGDHELATAFFGTGWRKHKEIMGGRAHLYLELLSTRKEYQGKGAGSILVKWGVDKADADVWECYLGSSAEAKGLYEKYGFAEVERFTYCDGAHAQSFMRRDVRQKWQK